MSAAWWGREAIDKTPPGTVDPPQLSDSGRDAIRAAVEARLAAFTPEWRLRTPGDAGDAMLKLYGELAEPLVARLNRLPEKAFREYLRTAGVMPAAANPARAMLAFTVAATAPRSVLLPTGFQASATAADGSGETVVFETEQTLYAAPGEIAMAFVQEGNSFFEVSITAVDTAASTLALGSTPRPGSALLLGLSSGVAPGPNITLWFQRAADAGPPPPVAQGASTTNSAPAQPILRWSFLDGGSFEAAEVIRDETRSLTQSGAVELRCPRSWRTGTPSGLNADRPLRWLRLQLAAGEFSTPPALAFVLLNTVAAVAARTVRNEVLEYVPGGDGRRLRVSQRPVLAKSLVLTVNEGAIGSGEGSGSGSAPVEWQEVDDLDAYGPEDRVFQLDEEGGELLFGDGVNGVVLPRGFRHVIAERYQVATGAAGGVDAEQINRLVSSAPFLTGVSNPLPATGGRDTESLDQTSTRGPQQIRARGRAVTTADYSLLALVADGADIHRAHAVDGVHAGLDDAEVAGAVSVYLLGPASADGPPYPDQGSLDAVARFLVNELAPAGITVVAAAPFFHQVSVRASLVIAAGADAGNVLRTTLRELDSYVDPLSGGSDGNGWPFGGPIKHTTLVQRLIARVPDLVGVSALNMTIDGETLPACSDFTPQPNSLLWPQTHELRLVEEIAS